MSYGGIFDLERKADRQLEIENLLQDSHLWSQPKEIQKLNQEKTLLSKTLDAWKELKSKLEDAQVLFEIAQEEEDAPSFKEAQSEIETLKLRVEEFRLKGLLGGQLDGNGAYLSIHAGAGGTESCDWAEMLLRMYLRYGEKNGFKVEILHCTEGDEAGIKSVTISFQGAYAYGYLKAESGVHRLVRISPFDSNSRRHTSFASVFVWAEVAEDMEEMEIKNEDIRIDTYRAGGAGGQHVNKTDSAVRITHLDTGIVVQCQRERSQYSNKNKAMKMLIAALYEKKRKEQQQEREKLESQKKANEWGSQIRSYVMHPYQMVKDHRTQQETAKVHEVMDGHLQPFIAAYLAAFSGSGSGSDTNNKR